LKERSPAPGPCLPPSGLFCLREHDERTREFIGAEQISPGGDDQFAELLHFASFQPARFSPSAFSSASKSRGLRIGLSMSVDGEIIAGHPAQCCKVVRTAWDAVIPPEIFSREGALIRRSDVRLIVPLI
jgi:hypothetical protein